MLSRLKYIAFVGGLFMASQAFAESEANLSNADSVEVPARSQHVVLDAAFISPAGHLVLQANGLDEGLRVNFYDAQSGDWLLQTALTSPEDVNAEQAKLAQGGYAKLEHMPMITLDNGTKIFNVIDTKGLCFRPYADFLEIAALGAQPVESAIYIKRKTPETVYSSEDSPPGTRPMISSHSCKSASGADAALTAHYEQQSPFFFSDKAGGFFVLVSRYAIHFDANGRSAFFQGQDNPVLLSPDDTQTLRAILSSANKNRNPQDAIDEADALIDRTAQAQVEEQ